MTLTNVETDMRLEMTFFYCCALREMFSGFDRGIHVLPLDKS